MQCIVRCIYILAAALVVVAALKTKKPVVYPSPYFCTELYFCSPKGRHFSLAPDQSRVSLQPDGQSVSLQKKYSLPNVLSFKPSDEEKKPVS